MNGSEHAPEHPAAVEAAAAVLTAHVEVPCSWTGPGKSSFWSECNGCDWSSDATTYRDLAAHASLHRAHVAEALAAAGLAAPLTARDTRALEYGRQILDLLDGADDRRDLPAQADDPAELLARLLADRRDLPVGDEAGVVARIEAAVARHQGHIAVIATTDAEVAGRALLIDLRAALATGTGTQGGS